MAGSGSNKGPITMEEIFSLSPSLPRVPYGSSWSESAMESQKLSPFSIEAERFAYYAPHFVVVDCVFAVLSQLAWLHRMLLLTHKIMLFSILDGELYKNKWLSVTDFYKMNPPEEENKDSSETEDDDDEDDQDEDDLDEDDGFSEEEGSDSDDSDDDVGGSSDDDDSDDDDDDDDNDDEDDDDDDDEEEDEDDEDDNEQAPSKKTK